jgi:hypothetical protein
MSEGGKSTFFANMDIRADDARLIIEEADGTDMVWLGDHTGSGHGALFLYNHGGAPTIKLTADSHANYINNGNSFGIGTSSPSELLSVYHATNSKVLISTGANGASQIYFGDNGSNLAGRIYYDHNGNTMRFHVNADERMRIDSSGNLLVGQTTASSNTVGTSLRPDGRNFYCANNNYSAHFNRKSSDGAIAHFAKDDTTVGSIGADDGRVYIESSGGANLAGIGFSRTAVAVEPRKNSGWSNAEVDIGSTTYKFKNGYFSGSLYGDGSNLTGVGGSTTYGAVGTYATAFHQHNGSSSNFNGGSTKSGSNLRSHMNPAADDNAYPFRDSTNNDIFNPSLSGTWRLMSPRSQGFAAINWVAGLWVRIS